MTNDFHAISYFKTLIFIILIYTLASCIDSGIVKYETHNFHKNIWNYKDTAVFKTYISDISTPYNCYIDIRNSGDYPFSNLYLFIITTLPEGKIIRDTLETYLADSQGKWLGKGLGDIKENRFLLKRGLRFPQKGFYKFKIIQAMRTNDLKGIFSIGMKIEIKIVNHNK